MSLESENTNAPSSFGVDSTMEDKESQQPIDREDGELEDGELDDEDDGGAPPVIPPVPAVSGKPAEIPSILSGVADMDYRAPSTQDMDYRSMPDIDYRREMSGGGELMHSMSKDSNMDFGEYPPPMQGGHEGMSENSDSDDARKHRKDKRKRKKKHRENEKHGHGDKGKKKRRRQYVDYDKVDDNGVPLAGPSEKGEYDGDMPAWPGSSYNSGRRDRPPRGPYDSPGYGSNGSHDGTSPREHGYYDYEEGRNHGDIEGRPRGDNEGRPRGDNEGRSRGDNEGRPRGDIEGRPRGERSPPGPYDSPYNSPPKEESERKSKYLRLDSSFSDYQRGNDRSSDKPASGKSMMSMLGDGYVDPNVAVVEKEEIFEKPFEKPFEKTESQNQTKSKKKQEKSEEYRRRKKEREDREREREDKGPPRKRREDTSSQICKYFQQGKCHNGDDCKYSHDCEPNPKHKNLCRRYIHGGCDRDDCRFMHGEFPCRFFYKGNCDKGANCRYSHADLTDETRAIMEQEDQRESGGTDHNKNKDSKKFSPSKGGNWKKPSLLGEPPAHMKEHLEKIKKIPSLFDIKVEKPKAPTNNLGPPRPPGPHGGPPGNPMSPNGPPMRPGFYGDMMGGSPRMGMMGPGGPPPMGPHGPGPMGPMRPPMGPGGPGLMGPGPGGPPPRGPPPPGFMGNFYGGPPPPVGPMPPVQPNMGGGGMHGKPDGGLHQDKDDRNAGPVNVEDADGSQDGATKDFLSQLTPSQRDMFMKLQSKKGGASESVGKADNWKDDTWYSSDEDAIDKKKKDPTSAPGGSAPKIDIGTMLNMLRNSVTSSTTPASQSPSGPHTAVRDPRMGGTAIPSTTTTRPDPRSAATRPPNTPSPGPPLPAAEPPKQPPPQAPALPPTPAPLGYDPEKVILASMENTGGVPYFLYKVTLEVIRPMLPKGIDPDDPKFKEDPRVRRYGRIGSAGVPLDDHPAGRSKHPPGGTDPRRRPSGDSVTSSPDVRLQRSDSKIAISVPPPMPKALLEPTVPPKPDALGVASVARVLPSLPLVLPDGLKKAPIPLPKLLDPRMGRQLSIDKDDKDKHKRDQTSPSTSKTPFSHRNDPRFRKKSKDGHSLPGNDSLNSSAESDSALNDSGTNNQKPPDSPPTQEEEMHLASRHRRNSDLLEDSYDEKLIADQQEMNETSPSTSKTDNKMDSADNKPFIPSEKTDTNRKNPMEFASPLGYYSEANDESSYDSYNSYNRPPVGGKSNKAENSGSNKSDITNSSKQSSNSISTDPRQSRTVANNGDGDQENAYPGSIGSMESDEMVGAVIPEKSIKEMFNIDPTASPFGPM